MDSFKDRKYIPYMEGFRNKPYEMVGKLITFGAGKIKENYSSYT